jgi:aminoethylphosphonate catabolism LysR family transcriptional regulator
VFQTQPALSEQVRRLEQEYDVLLFNREKKRVQLTPAGERLLVLSKRFFEAEDHMEDYLSETRAAIDGTLRIVADSAHHVTAYLSRFRQRHPDVFISVKTGNTAEVLKELRNYTAEIGIVGSMGPGPDFDCVSLGSTSIVAFCAVGYLPEHVRGLRLQDLGQYPLVFREEGSRTRQKLADAAQAQKVALRPALEVEGREAMRDVVASGSGIGFVSEAEFGNDARLVKIPLEGIDLRMSETMVTLTARKEVRIIRAFMECVRELGADEESLLV